MQLKELPSSEYLNACFRLDPETGDLWWKDRPREHFASDLAHSRFRKIHSGKRAGHIGLGGYWVCVLHMKAYLAHRIVYAMVNGHLAPEMDIDHIDQDKRNNRPENLRAVRRALNCRNKALQSNNKSGVAGVWFSGAHKRWISKVTVDKEVVFFEKFFSFDEAVQARAKYLAEHPEAGFTKIHGLKKCIGA